MTTEADAQATITAMAGQIAILTQQMQALMASQATSTPTPSTTSLRPNKPETFSGTRHESVDNFLFQLGSYFQVLGVTNHQQRIMFAITLLREHAIDWWRNLELTLVMEELTWQDFSTSIRAEFKPVSSRSMARDKLATLRQHTSVATYTHEFRALILEIPGMTEDERLDRYKRGLKYNIRKELELREPSTMSEAIRMAERLDAVEFSLNRRPDRSFFQRSERPFMPSTNVNCQSDRFCQGPTPMELGNINTRPYKQPTLPSTSRNPNTCWYCHEQGHIAINCPNKPKPWLKQVSSHSSIRSDNLLGNAHRQ